MKVVINSCFGGFGLSPLATKRLAELNGQECYFFVDGRKPNGELCFRKLIPASIEEAQKAFLWYACDIPNYDDGHIIDRGRNLKRHDLKLIQVIEELGDKANGRHAQLSIIEIPDGVDYTIEEYDGNEHVAETHRTWYANEA